MNTTKPTQHSNGALLVLIAAILWSSTGFFAKAPFFKGWSGASLGFWRALFALAVLAPLVRKPRWDWRLPFMALAFAAMSYTYLTAVMSGSAANAIWLQMTAQGWVVLISVFLLNEPLSRRDKVLLMFTSAGVGFILFFELQGSSFSAVLWGLASGILYAIVVLLLRHLRDLDSAWLVALNHAAAAACLAPLALGSAPLPSGIQWPLLIAFGVIQLGIPYLLFARGLRSIPGYQASCLGLAEPILLPVWAYLAWGERPAWWTMIGAMLILAGLVLRFAPLRREARSAELPQT